LREPWVGGFKLSISGHQVACDETKRVEQLDNPGQDGVDHVIPDTIAEVTQVILAGDGVVEASQLPVAEPFVGLVEIAAEVGIIDVVIHVGGYL
jgi:hypothetical protein